MAESDRLGQSEHPPILHADYALPPALGLCPDHGGEFYMPLELPLSSPLPRCPVRGCARFLVVYTPEAS